MKKILFYVIVVLSLSSCKNNTSVVLQEEPINLYPNKELIKKKYYKYSLFNPFFPNDTLYTPIEPSKANPKRAKTLIKATKPYNTQTFKRYIVDKLNGQYSSYIVENDTILYRYYFKHYKENEAKEFDTREKIENYLKKYKIKHKFIGHENNLSIFILMKNNILPPSFCVIESDNTSLSIQITYNIKDTIKSLPSQSLNPFKGMDIEN